MVICRKGFYLALTQHSRWWRFPTAQDYQKMPCGNQLEIVG
jgi:hypothetical protein